ncbi:MAG: ribose-phosphate diphosphokinase [Nanoarchaeota archaeon]|nr:ribose-phosphate diphosphokinase [Nanoarchaeota archaeon]
MIIASFEESSDLARKVARRAKSSYVQFGKHDFPDGEGLIKIPEVKGKELVVVAQIHRPDAKVMPLIFALATAKELGAKSITLVAPYMPYMRQDKRFNQGECISNMIFGRLLSRYADRVITIDPHLHRVHRLSKIFPTKSTRLSAVGAIAEYIKKHHSDAFIVGPDAESYQWARKVAKLSGTKARILLKKRYGDRNVKISGFKDGLKGKTAILVDDIISSGHTMMETVKEVKKHRPRSIICIGVHGIFSGKADLKLKRLGAKVVTTNTIPHKTNRIDISPVIAEALKHG